MHEELKAKLSQLQQNLAAVNKLDDDSRKMLEQVDTDIQRLLNDGGQEDGLSERLEQQAVAFEERHPAVAGVMKDIMDVLAKMGV